jgi:drug/metabolite transporter (DMT)-like permease
MKIVNPKIIALLGVIFVSFASIFIRLSQAPSLIIANYRLAFTVLLIAPSAIIKNRNEIKGIGGKTLGLSILSGCFLALHFATWISSLKYTSIASSTVLVNTHTIFIVIGSYFILKEKTSMRKILYMAITVLGSILISLGDSSLGSNVVYGDILAILGAVFVSGYIIIGRIVRQSLSAAAYTFVVYSSCTLTLLVMNLATKTPLYPYALKEWLLFLALALFCTILGHSLFNWALEYIKPTFLSVAVLGEPVFASLWAIMVFREIPKIWQVTGGMIIIGGIYLSMKLENKEHEQIPAVEPQKGL